MSIVETTPLLLRLVEELGVPIVESGFPAGLTLLFLPSHERQHLETVDIAVILPDLIGICRKILVDRLVIEPAIASAAFEARLVDEIDGLTLPAVVVVQGNQPVGSIARMRDWADYLARFEAILAPLIVSH